MSAKICPKSGVSMSNSSWMAWLVAPIFRPTRALPGEERSLA
jgi:hypothetical protein